MVCCVKRIIQGHNVFEISDFGPPWRDVLESAY